MKKERSKGTKNLKPKEAPIINKTDIMGINTTALILVFFDRAGLTNMYTCVKKKGIEKTTDCNIIVFIYIEIDSASLNILSSIP
nr:hypothetical protein [Bacillus sp. FJAT-27445]